MLRARSGEGEDILGAPAETLPGPTQEPDPEPVIPDESSDCKTNPNPNPNGSPYSAEPPAFIRLIPGAKKRTKKTKNASNLPSVPKTKKGNAPLPSASPHSDRREAAPPQPTPQFAVIAPNTPVVRFAPPAA